MYVILYILILTLSTFFINKKNAVDGEEFLEWDSRSIYIIAGCFILAVILEVIPFKNVFTYIVYSVILIIVLFYVNKIREEWIINYKQQIDAIYDSLGKLVSNDERSYTDLPFKIIKGKDKIDLNRINEITVRMNEPRKFTDEALLNIVNNFGNYFPYYNWQYDTNFSKQEVTFIGKKLPPEIAPWPGSDFRPTLTFPMGLNGEGEVMFDLGAKDTGESSFMFPDGKKAETVKMPSAPQTFIVGSTGGGKAIWVDQELW